MAKVPTKTQKPDYQIFAKPDHILFFEDQDITGMFIDRAEMDEAGIRQRGRKVIAFSLTGKQQLIQKGFEESEIEVRTAADQGGVL